ncbi:hypothetical protein DFH27DRAFT_211442 [Peziza echinospora]|nr:hypothetical protein DFH27DRAFT_211442 [Peziza echinospora]
MVSPTCCVPLLFDSQAIFLCNQSRCSITQEKIYLMARQSTSHFDMEALIELNQLASAPAVKLTVGASMKRGPSKMLRNPSLLQFQNFLTQDLPNVESVIFCYETLPREYFNALCATYKTHLNDFIGAYPHSLVEDLEDENFRLSEEATICTSHTYSCHCEVCERAKSLSPIASTSSLPLGDESQLSGCGRTCISFQTSFLEESLKPNQGRIGSEFDGAHLRNTRPKISYGGGDDDGKCQVRFQYRRFRCVKTPIISSGTWAYYSNFDIIEKSHLHQKRKSH